MPGLNVKVAQVHGSCQACWHHVSEDIPTYERALQAASKLLSYGPAGRLSISMEYPIVILRRLVMPPSPAGGLS